MAYNRVTGATSHQNQYLQFESSLVTQLTNANKISSQPLPQNYIFKGREPWIIQSTFTNNFSNIPISKSNLSWVNVPEAPTIEVQIFFGWGSEQS